MSCKCVDPKSLTDLCAFCQNEYLAYVHCTDYTPEEPGLKQYIESASPESKSVEFNVEPGAVKHDSGKAPIGIIPGVALIEEAKAFNDGRKKYGLWNYKKGMDWTRVIDAALRHIVAFKEGEEVAADSGVHHLGHARACLGMLLDYSKNKLGNDDRYKP